MDSKYSELHQSHDDQENVPLSGDSTGDFSKEHWNLNERVLKYEKQSRLRRPLQVFAVIIFALTFFSLGIAVRSFRGIDEVACLDTAWDEARKGITFETREFNPRFTGLPSPYMGQPNIELDKLWYDLSELRNFGVDYSTLERMNRSRGAVQFPQDGRYQVAMEAFHQLHCLNYIRMYSYMDYYEKIDFDMVAESLEERRDHKDHCVEVLRQRLMCNPDLNIYTYHWVSRHNSAWGNLFSSHRCVNWDNFHGWAQDNLVSFYPPKTRPEGVEVWE